jgi:PTS system nitrogen regulatory IIA component
MQGIAFGQTIRLLRQAKGISLREMAKKLGVSPAFLSQIEAGRQHKIPKNRILQVAQMLGVSESYLLGTARRVHPDIIEYLRNTPEAAEFMITALKSGFEAEDFADLRESLNTSAGKGPLRRGRLPAKGKARTPAKQTDRNSLDAYLDPALCVAGVGVQNKDRLFQRFVKLVTKRNKMIAAEELLGNLDARESQAPTSVGGGVAIPHAYLEDLERPIIGAVQLKRAITYSPNGDEKVKTVFFLIGNENRPEEHISTLARIARLCSDREFLEMFNKARTHRELYKTIIRWDKRIGQMQ